MEVGGGKGKEATCRGKGRQRGGPKAIASYMWRQGRQGGPKARYIHVEGKGEGEGQMISGSVNFGCVRNFGLYLIMCLYRKLLLSVTVLVRVNFFHMTYM